ncbi:hypothetical protein BH11ARM2_BH11ARM2_00760 [soil metagenome]
MLLDEDIKSKRLVRLLAEAGHDVATTADLALDGHRDAEVLAGAVRENRVVLTYNCDDFRALHEAGGEHPGILLVYQEPGKSLSREEIVRTIGNLEGSAVPIPGSLHALNHWRY